MFLFKNFNYVIYNFIFSHTKLGEFSDTVKYLARRKDAATLITAAEIAFLCNDEMSSKSLAEQAIIATLINSEYDFTRNIIEKFPYLKVYLHICFMFRFFPYFK